MTLEELSLEDKTLLKEIYEQINKASTDLSHLPQYESLLDQALKLAENYGQSHPLYISLSQTIQEQLIPAKRIPEKSKEKYNALADLKLFILGDLLGWFKSEEDKE